MLNKNQVHHFHSFGFLIIRQMFTCDEVKALILETEAACVKKLGREMGEKESFWAGEFVEESPALMKLVEDDRIYLVMKKLLGEDIIWNGSEGMRGINPELANHSWHFDGHKTSRNLDYLRTKVMLYLDPQSKDSGALRVIPGSHRDPFHKELMALQDAHQTPKPVCFGIEGPQIPSYAIETEPGDIVIFNQWLYHAVYGKQGLRRAIVLKFAPRPRTKAHFTMLWNGSSPVFEPHSVFRNNQSARIQGLVEGFEELGQKTEFC